MDEIQVRYAIRYLSPYGIQQDEFTRFIGLDVAKGINKPGWLMLDLHPSHIDFNRIKLDERIQIQRKVGDRAWYTLWNTSFLIRKWRRGTLAGGREIVRLAGPSATDLLRRRITAYDAGTSYTSKSGFGDDVLKQFVRDNFVSATDAGRNIGSLFEVAENVSLGPSVEKSATRKNILEICQELSDLCAQKGTPVYFDVVNYGVKFLLRTYIGQRGRDRTSGTERLLVSTGNKNLGESYYEEDHANEATVVYTGGTGTEASRAVESYVDTARAAASPLNRIEEFQDSFDSGSDSDKLLEESKTRAYEKRPVITVAGEIRQTPYFRFGPEWDLGDKLPVYFYGKEVVAHVTNARLNVREGKETVRGEYEDT